MAKFTTAIELDVALKNAEEIENAKKRMRELRQIAMEAVQTFGEFSPEAQKAKQAFAEVKDQIDDFKEQVAALNPDKFEQINTVVSAGARGFQALTGAQALFGKESENLQAAMVKLQGVMALTEGLAGIGRMRNELVSIGGPVLSKVTTAFKGFGQSVKATLISTGIGAFIVALGVIAAKWDDIKTAVNGVSKAQEDSLAKTQELVQAETDKKDLLDNQDQILKRQGLTEEEILQKKIKQEKAIIAGLEAQLAQQKSIKKIQEETAQRNKDILQNIIRLVSGPVTLLLAGIDMAGKAFGKNFGLEEKFSGGIAGMIFDPEEVKKEGDAAIAETEKALNRAKNQLAGYENAVDGIHASAAEKRKAEAAKAKAERERAAKEEADRLKREAEQAERDLQDRIKKANDEADAAVERAQRRESAINDIILTAKDKEMRATTDRFSELISEAEKYGEDTKALEEAYQKAMQAIRDKYAEEEATKEKDKHDKINAFRIQATKDALQTLIDLNEAAAGTSEESRRRAFENNKKLQLAMAIVDTYQSASAAYASQLIPGDPSSLIRAQIAAGLSIASGIVRVKKIVETTFDSNSVSGGIGGGASPTVLAPQGFTRPKGIEELSNKDTKVYVLESDITMTQQRTKRNKSLSIVE